MSTSMNEMSNYSNSTNDTGSSDAFSYDYDQAGDLVYNDPVVRNCLIFCYTLVFVPCVLGNILVIYVVAANRSMRTVTNFFLANLAVADLFVGICCILPDLFYWISPTWFLGEVICKVYQFTKGMTTSVSISLLTVISVERYIAITLPMHSRRILTLARMRVAIVIVWFIGVGYNAPNLHLYGTVVYVDNVTVYCQIKDYTAENLRLLTIYGNVSMCLWYFAPLLTMFILYSLIARRLWISSGKGHMALSETPKAQQQLNNKKEQKCTRHQKYRSVPFTGKVIISLPRGKPVRPSRDLSDISGSDVSSVSSEEGHREKLSKDFRQNLPNHVLFEEDVKILDETGQSGTGSHQEHASDVCIKTGGLTRNNNKENVVMFCESSKDAMSADSARNQPTTGKLQPAKSAITLNDRYFLNVPETIHRKSKSTSHINENGAPNASLWLETKSSVGGSENGVGDASSVGRRSRLNDSKLYKRLPVKDDAEGKTLQRESQEPIWVERKPKKQEITEETPNLDINQQRDDNRYAIEYTERKSNYRKHIKFFTKNGNKNKYNNPTISYSRKKKASTCSTSSRDSINLQTGRLRRTKSVNERVLTARKKVIRLLVAVVGSFALCLLPFQVVNVWYQVGEYPFHTMFGQLFMPVVRIIYFSNSALNPILYAFLSDNFRMKMKDALLCRRGRNLAARRNLNRPKWQKVNKFETPSRATTFERSEV
ncbi:trissin receptor-like [Ptychodera flava]|uniref:trissin receptor-like n=1 Tax=Ptychodera flava TaxID=63121 RepID=UPI00396A7061